MKITGLEPFAIQANNRGFIFCIVNTDAGISGIGECGVMTRSQAILGAFEQIREQIVAEDPSRGETHYIRLVTHNPLGPVSSAACLALNLSTPNFGVQEQPTRPGSSLNDLIPVQIEWQDGHLLPPTRPGLGIEFDREALRRMPPAVPVTSRRLRREDNSYTNW